MAKQYVLKVEQKSFVNEKGDKVVYMDCSVEIAGFRFKLSPFKEDKRLFNHLLKNDM